MRWLGGRESGNVEDRRGMGGGGLLVGGGIGSVVIAIIVMLLGGDPGDVLNQSPQSQATQAPADPQADDEAAKFTRKVLASTEDIWTKIFAEQGARYRQPTLVMFRGVTQSGCGTATEASGPFYCPGDQKLYIDLSFYDELSQRFGAPGDFAMAYVIAHEVGHHVQNQLGIMNQTDQLRARMSERQYNKVSVRLELQADFFAGVWANQAQGKSFEFEPGDIEEALTAANAIGDDRIQEQTRGHVVPDAFTHGSSAQRVYWFKKGLKTGDIKQGDTFNSNEDSNLQ
ncbi:neutral zinc metallopeptidase [Spirosoma sp. BT702]|uniref:Neutral zinc metallopeptidase n=1 Tax=Spirosoma profusum TaxID=2771354 RepID=A0A926Y4G7_9BACT|nr:neutral zinc metallopeptidase [Spirosoma profusum]MBD2703116.1 neutral zinc metallopeptidase [Spirosoma profusum]